MNDAAKETWYTIHVSFLFFMKTKYSQKTIQNVRRAPFPRVLLNVCTHGNERVGLKVAEYFKKTKLRKGSLEVNIANERALKAKKRFITHDLNRVFPGKSTGSYEERLAYAMSPYVAAFDIVLDVHSTETGMDSAAIITKLTPTLRRLARSTGLKRVIHMKATKSNALISNAKIGIAFECGKDKDPRTLRQTIRGIEGVLGELGMRPKRASSTTPILYTAYGASLKPEGAKSLTSIRNFALVRKHDVLGYDPKTKKAIRAKKAFYPILFGNNTYTTMFGFEATKGKL